MKWRDKTKFRYERPNISRKNEAIDFINEFYEYGSKINGVGGWLDI